MYSTIKEKILYPSAFTIFSFFSDLYRKSAKPKEFWIMFYHRILDITENFPFLTKLISASPFEFKRQIEFLRANYNIISFNDLIEVLHNENTLPERSVVITFDDGYKDFYTNAYPILHKYNIPATVFLTTDFIDHNRLGWWDKIAFAINKTKKSNLELKEIGKINLKPLSRRKIIYEIIKKLKNLKDDEKNLIVDDLMEKLNVNIEDEKLSKKVFLNWDEVREISEHGISLGAHTVSHPILTKIPIDQAKREILQSKHRIEEEVDVQVSVFSYPNGKEADFNESIKKILRESGFRAAVTTIYGSNCLTQFNFDLYALNRIEPLNSKLLVRQMKSTILFNLMNYKIHSKKSS